MYRDEEVGLVAVGYVGAFGQRDVDIGGAGEDDLHVGVVVLDKLTELFGHGEGDVLLLRPASLGTGFCTSVTGVNYHSAYLVSVFFL